MNLSFYPTPRRPQRPPVPAVISLAGAAPRLTPPTARGRATDCKASVNVGDSAPVSYRRMQGVQWFLFDSALALSLTAFAGLFVLFVLWRRGGSPRPLLIGLVVTAVLLVVEALVVTPREHADRVLAPLENDLLAGRLDVLPDLLADDFQAGDSSDGLFDRGEFVAAARKTLRGMEMRWLTRSNLEVQSHSPARIIARAVYLCNLRTNAFAGTVKSAWRIEFVRVGDAWKIGRIDPPEIDGYQMPHWNFLRP